MAFLACSGCPSLFVLSTAALLWCTIAVAIAAPTISLIAAHYREKETG